jgi:hypothetical protein
MTDGRFLLFILKPKCCLFYSNKPFDMFDYSQTELAENSSFKYIIYNDDEQLNYADFLSHLQDNETFRAFYIDLLSDIPFRAWQWETPAVTASTLKQPFEFVVHNSPGIDLPPDYGPFRQYFEELDSDETIAVFDNLGKDAKLIAPAPHPNKLNYSHIGIFTDLAPKEQQHALWKTVGRVTDDLISAKPLWLNTAGGGVAWLHVRLDSRPKYYRHKPYTSA